MNPDDLVLAILALVLPPLAVFIRAGLGGQFWLNLLLTVLGCWVPGVIHAIWVVVVTSSATAIATATVAAKDQKD